jgi:hypothetical protein
MGAQISIIHQTLSARHKLNSRFIELDKAIMSVGLSPARCGFESLSATSCSVPYPRAGEASVRLVYVRSESSRSD